MGSSSHLWLGRFVVTLAVAAACGPQSIDRVSDLDAGPSDRADTGDLAGAVDLVGGSGGGAGGSGAGTGGAQGGQDGPADLSDPPPDRPAEVTMPEAGSDLALDSSLDEGDIGPEAPVARTVLMVVGDDGGNPSTAEGRLRTSLMTRGFTVRVVADGAAADVNGVHLVIITETCTSTTVTTKYREVPVPVLNLEPALMDDMGMTGPMNGIDYEQTAGTMINVVLPLHPMAAGTSGTVTPVTGTGSFFVWGVPSAAAEKVATLDGMPARFTIFGYARGAMMVGLVAPARRVGFFAGNSALERLNDNGVKLLNAAIDWALSP